MFYLSFNFFPSKKKHLIISIENYDGLLNVVAQLLHVLLNIQEGSQINLFVYSHVLFCIINKFIQFVTIIIFKIALIIYEIIIDLTNLEIIILTTLIYICLQHKIRMILIQFIECHI